MPSGLQARQGILVLMTNPHCSIEMLWPFDLIRDMYTFQASSL